MIENIEGAYIEINGDHASGFKGTVIDVKVIVIRSIGNDTVNLSSKAFKGMYNLESLLLYKIHLTDYVHFKYLKRLKLLTIEYGSMQSLPSEFEALELLEQMTITDSGLSSIDLKWALLDKIKFLELDCNNFTEIPQSFVWHKSLVSISLGGNPIKYIELKNVKKMPRMKSIYLGGTKLKTINLPNKKLTTLERLDLNSCDIIDLPIDILKLEQLKGLYLANNPLSNFEMNSLLTNRCVTVLDISECNFKEIPVWIKLFEVLFELLIEDNPISEIPDWVGQLPSLCVIHLKGTLITDDQIKMFKNNHSDRTWTIRRF